MPYIGNSPGTGTRNRFIYTATASQTTFSGADDNGKTLKYSDSDYVDVYLNGICLVPVTDYTSTSKTSIVLTQAASLNDTLEVVAYDIATISDTVSKADGGQFDGAVTVEADFTVDSNTLHVDSANNKVGILDNAPDAALHVYNGMLQVGSKDGDTSIQQNANAIRIAAVPNSSTEWGGLQWYREFSNYIGAEIIAARASSTESDTDLIFKTSSTSANASERMRIRHDGGLTFNGDTAEANALSDYEEGTFTYTLAGATSGGWTSRTGYVTGRYTKIGQLVSVQIRFESTTRNSPQGNLQLTGLPFATADHPSLGNGSGQVGVLLRGNTDSSVASHFVSYGNSSTILTFFTQDTGQSSISAVNSATDTTGQIEGTIQFSYVTDS